MNENEKKKKPEIKYRAGAISVTVWKNQKDGNEFPYYTVNLEKNYKDQDDKWKSTNTMLLDEIPKAIAALNKAYETHVVKEIVNEAG